MSSDFQIVLSHFVALITAAVMVFLAVLTAYFRDQVTVAVTWVSRPLVARLPWNRTLGPSPFDESGFELISLLTVAQLAILNADGSRAIYTKTSDYEVRAKSLSEYREGVTAEGTATNFATLIGQLMETTKEHGFHVSRVDLGNVLQQGARFQNTYSVDLIESFVADEEHWTQEVAVPTEHLTIRVIFPKSRPPSLLRCKVVKGLKEQQLPTSAHLVNLHGRSMAVWELPRPRLGAIFKLEGC
jgi:hypothetical protein